VQGCNPSVLHSGVRVSCLAPCSSSSRKDSGLVSASIVHTGDGQPVLLWAMHYLHLNVSFIAKIRGLSALNCNTCCHSHHKLHKPKPPCTRSQLRVAKSSGRSRSHSSIDWVFEDWFGLHKDSVVFECQWYFRPFPNWPCALLDSGHCACFALSKSVTASACSLTSPCSPVDERAAALT
jgi:hypothetical protein